MDDDSTRQSVLFSDLAGKPVVAKFDQKHASSDGGAILLQACDRQLGLTEALIGGIDDRRQSGKIPHAIGDLVRQRLYAIACGYPDGNDAGRLGADPISKLLCGRDPVKGRGLGIAADALALRECVRSSGFVPDGDRARRDRDRAPSPTVEAQGQADHDRSGSDR